MALDVGSRGAGEGWRPAGGSRISALIAVWAGVVLVVYFRHVWPLLFGAEGRWTWPQVGQALRYTGLPHAHEALVSAGSALGGASVCALAVIGLGTLVARVFAPRPTSAAEGLILAATFGAGTLGCVLYWMAGVGSYTPDTLRTLIRALAAGACALAGVSAFRVRLRFLRPAPREWPWVIITVGAALYAAFCALAPESQYDALWYHLELPGRWLASGHPVDDINEYVALYPLGWDLLFGAALAVDGPVAAKLLHWMALPACAAVAGLIARTICPRTSPWLSAAIFVTAPTVFWEATTAYIDLGLALFVGGAIYSLLRAHDTGDRRWLFVAGLQLGFACAAKHLGLVALAAILPVFAWSEWRSRVGAGRWAARARTVAGAVAIITVLALVVPLPWYLRSWNASGNPVFPDMFHVFGAQPPERWDALTERGLQKFKDHFGRPRSVVHVLALPWDMTIHSAEFGGTLGPLFLAGLPVMILSAVRHRPAAALFTGAAIYLAVWATPLSSYQLRFLVPIWMICAPLLAAGTQTLLDGVRSRRVSAGVLIALGGVLVLSLPPWTIFHEGDRQGWHGWLTHVVHEPPTAVVLGGISRDEWLRAEVQTYGAWQWLNARAPEGSRVLTFFSGDQFYAKRGRIWSEAVNARGATWGATGGDRARVQEELRRLGVSYVLAPVAEAQTAEHKRLDLLRPAIMGPALERVYHDRWTVLYAVRADTGAVDGTIDHSYGR
jgi:4-amino-4-deoxy-L-arabinose transferase-like glycosyltransferase